MNIDRSGSLMGRLWAGWRKQYVSGAVETNSPSRSEKTVFEEIFNGDNTSNTQSYVLWEGELCAAVLNLFPYVSGHILVLPKRAVSELNDLTENEYSELWEGVRLAVTAINRAYKPDGVNVGINIGEAAGASIPDHIHVHCIPRWKGDTTFLTTVAEVRMIPETLTSSWENLREHWPSTQL